MGHVTFRVGKRVVGIFYELPDGRIADTYGFDGLKKTVSYYFDDDSGPQTPVTFEEFDKWIPRRDLKDFPNARDPRLPYVFDLYWDIKHLSGLRREISGHPDEKFIRRAAVEYGISL